MPNLLERLREEHRTMHRLLTLAERELERFDRAEQPDYELLAAIADYFVGFPERTHHPNEDLIEDRLRERAPETLQSVPDLQAEHEALSASAHRFREAVRNVVLEAEVPRSAFDAALRAFIKAQRTHMQMENERFFPAALSHLTAQDWMELAEAVSQERDRLQTPAEEDYEAMSGEILRWAEEEETSPSS